MQALDKRAAIYCRISETDEKVDKVERQREVCEAFAAKHSYQVVGIYEDDGISAFKDVQRPRYEELVADAQAGKFDVVVAYRQDRFSRDWWVTASFVRVCQEQGIVWHTIVEGKNELSGNNALLAVFNGFQASDEQTKKIASLRQAFDARRAKGLPLWGVRPFGFELDRIEHRQSEAEEIRWACDHVLAGGSLYSIIQSWNERGVTTTRGNKWSYATLQQVLQRPSNAGLVESKDDILDVTAVWEPIVDPDTYKAVCALLSDPSRRITDKREPRWLCAGLAKCGVCGQVLRSSSVRTRAGELVNYYRCSAKALGGARGTRHVSVKTAELDPLVRDGVINSYLVAPRDAWPEATGAMREIARLAAKLRENVEETKRIAALVGKRGIDTVTLVKRGDALANENEALEAGIAECRRQSAHAAMVADLAASLWASPHRKVPMKQAVKAKRQLADRFDAMPLAQRRTLVHSSLNIVVHGGRSLHRIDIEHKLAPGLDDPETRELRETSRRAGLSG